MSFAQMLLHANATKPDIWPFIIEEEFFITLILVKPKCKADDNVDEAENDCAAKSLPRLDLKRVEKCLRI
jgi:hypothetical protein